MVFSTWQVIKEWGKNCTNWLHSVHTWRQLLWTLKKPCTTINIKHEFTGIFGAVVSPELVQRIFKHGKIQNNSLTPDTKLNISIYGMSSYVIIYRSYELLKWYIFRPPCIYTNVCWYFYSTPHTNLENINLSFHGFVFCQRLFHAVLRVELWVFAVVNVSTHHRIRAR